MHNYYRAFLRAVYFTVTVKYAARRRSGCTRSKPILRADKVSGDVPLKQDA
jgi:hypothetical protein